VPFYAEIQKKSRMSGKMDEIFSNLFPVKKRNQRKRRENRRFGEKKRKKSYFF